jgi:hypothetical protein
MATPRPSLDAITMQRAHQVAIRENRSLANAIATLVNEAWKARHQAEARSRLTDVIAGRGATVNAAGPHK